MVSSFIKVNKKTLGEIIILVDESQKLSEKLEDNNQEIRILLHTLVSTSKRQKNLGFKESGKRKLLALEELAKEKKRKF